MGEAGELWVEGVRYERSGGSHSTRWSGEDGTQLLYSKGRVGFYPNRTIWALGTPWPCLVWKMEDGLPTPEILIAAGRLRARQEGALL